MNMHFSEWFVRDASAVNAQHQVRKIVVYKHGVGYFEREGKVTGNKQVALTFKSAQMKDLLKSLYAVDLSGGRIATINYDTKDPLSKQLELWLGGASAQLARLGDLIATPAG